jgi:hypothetical protein
MPGDRCNLPLAILLQLANQAGPIGDRTLSSAGRGLSDQVRGGVCMGSPTPFEQFWQPGPPKRGYLDRLTLIMVLMIVWRLIGGC